MALMLAHQDVVTLLLSLAVLLAAARIAGEVARKLGQSAVIGELLAGVVLGQTVLGRFAPALHGALFPTEGPVALALAGLTAVALVLFLMVAGMEVDLSTVWKQGRAALVISVVGMIVPLAMGLGGAFQFPGAFGGLDGTDPLVFALFVGTAMSITALPVIAKVLLDLQLFRTEIGMTIIAAAVINDILGWLAFAAVLAMMDTATGPTLTLPWTLALTLGFAAFTLTLGRWLLNRALPWIQAHTSWPGGIISFSVVITLLAGSFTEWIGVHAILGAFLVGVALGDSPHLRERTRGTIDHFVSFIFAPLFFASIGLRIDFVANFEPLLVAVVFVVAVVGKVLPCAGAARLSGFAPRDSWAIGFGMNARGAMEIVLGLLALQAGIIGEPLFVALVIMAIGTSIMSGAAIQSVLGAPPRVSFVDFASSRTFVSRPAQGTPREVIHELATKIAEAHGMDVARIFDPVWEREQILSSGVGQGIAIPHARLADLAQPLVAVAALQHPIDFDARDGVPARIVVLLLTPASDTKVHLSLLASVVRLLAQENRLERAASAANWTQFLAVIRADPD